MLINGTYSSIISLLFCQVIEDPVEIIGNDRELKGFYSMDEVIRLVGYFKSERSSRMLKIKTERLSLKKTLSN